MTNIDSNTNTTETSVLKSLRSLMPHRVLTYDEATVTGRVASQPSAGAARHHDGLCRSRSSPSYHAFESSRASTCRSQALPTGTADIGC